MYDVQSLSHTKWECKYHIIWIPKYRKKAIFEGLRKYLGEIFRDLATQKECKVVEGHLMPDHVPILISILPKYSVSRVVGQHFWARGVMFRRLVRMRMPCESIFKSKRKRTNVLSN